MAYPKDWPVYVHRGSETLHDLWTAPPLLRVGDGLILGTPEYPGAERWRVVDVWHSYDKHGRFDMGTHVFVELVSDTEDDYPKRLAPDYFVTEPDDAVGSEMRHTPGIVRP